MLFMLLVSLLLFYIYYLKIYDILLLKYEFLIFWLFFLIVLWGKPVYHSIGFEFAVSGSVPCFMICVADMKLCGKK